MIHWKDDFSSLQAWNWWKAWLVQRKTRVSFFLSSCSRLRDVRTFNFSCWETRHERVWNEEGKILVFSEKLAVQLDNSVASVGSEQQYHISFFDIYLMFNSSPSSQNAIIFFISCVDCVSWAWMTCHDMTHIPREEKNCTSPSQFHESLMFCQGHRIWVTQLKL